MTKAGGNKKGKKSKNDKTFAFFALFALFALFASPLSSPDESSRKRFQRSDSQPFAAGRDAPPLASRSSQAAQLMFEKKASMYFGRSAGA